MAQRADHLRLPAYDRRKSCLIHSMYFTGLMLILEILRNSDPTSAAQNSLGTAVNRSSFNVCEQCDRSGRDVWFCNVCNFSLCTQCWDVYLPHKKGRLGPGGIPHEKTSAAIADKVSKALAPGPSDAFASEELHRDDEKTAWFGGLALLSSNLTIYPLNFFLEFESRIREVH